MTEYIEREALERSLDERLGRLLAMCGRHDSFVQGFEDCIGKVEEFPAADVAPVVHGRWVGLEYDGYADGYPVYDLWECSECGEEVRGEDVPDTHLYCPNCGARMDGDKDG